jgi:hypothetical protein
VVLTFNFLGTALNADRVGSEHVKNVDRKVTLLSADFHVSLRTNEPLELIWSDSRKDPDTTELSCAEM